MSGIPVSPQSTAHEAILKLHLAGHASSSVLCEPFGGSLEEAKILYKMTHGSQISPFRAESLTCRNRAGMASASMRSIPTVSILKEAMVNDLRGRSNAEPLRRNAFRSAWFHASVDLTGRSTAMRAVQTVI
jgi:hypothetical protein